MKKTVLLCICLSVILLISCGKGVGSCVHEWGDWVITESSTCEKQGKQERECTLCGAKEKEDAPLHNLRYNEARPVTCTRKGWDAYVSCKDCDYTTYCEIAATDHVYENNFCKNCGRTALSMGIVGNTAVAFGIGCYEGEHLVIPAEYKGYPVTELGLDSFPYVDGLKSVTLPNTITKMSGAFNYCSDLEMVIAPNSLKGKEGRAFQGNMPLKEITYVPDNQLEGYDVPEKDEKEVDTLLDIQIENNLAVVKGLGSFEGENIVIPETYKGKFVDVIADGAFENCTHIRSVVMPYRVRKIGSRAFAGCTKLTEVIFDNSNSETKVTLSHDAFEGCSNIHLEIPWNMSDDLTCFNEAVVTATIHSGIDGWISIYPSQVKREGDTFEGDSKVPCVRYFSNLKTLIIGDDVVGIWNNAFKGCDNFEELIISGNVMKMGFDTFKDCRYLKTVTLKKGVSVIGQKAFDGCIRLRRCIVEQPENWTTEAVLSNTSEAAEWLKSNTIKRRPFYSD